MQSPRVSTAFVKYVLVVSIWILSAILDVEGGAASSDQDRNRGIQNGQSKRSHYQGFMGDSKIIRDDGKRRKSIGIVPWFFRAAMGLNRGPRRGEKKKRSHRRGHRRSGNRNDAKSDCECEQAENHGRGRERLQISNNQPFATNGVGGPILGYTGEYKANNYGQPSQYGCSSSSILNNLAGLVNRPATPQTAPSVPLAITSNPTNSGVNTIPALRQQLPPPSPKSNATRDSLLKSNVERDDSMEIKRPTAKRLASFTPRTAARHHNKWRGESLDIGNTRRRTSSLEKDLRSKRKRKRHGMVDDDPNRPSSHRSGYPYDNANVEYPSRFQYPPPFQPERLLAPQHPILPLPSQPFNFPRGQNDPNPIYNPYIPIPADRLDPTQVPPQYPPKYSYPPQQYYNPPQPPYYPPQPSLPIVPSPAFPSQTSRDMGFASKQLPYINESGQHYGSVPDQVIPNPGEPPATNPNVLGHIVSLLRRVINKVHRSQQQAQPSSTSQPVPIYVPMPIASSTPPVTQIQPQPSLAPSTAGPSTTIVIPR